MLCGWPNKVRLGDGEGEGKGELRARRFKAGSEMRTPSGIMEHEKIGYKAVDVVSLFCVFVCVLIMIVCCNLVSCGVWCVGW